MNNNIASPVGANILLVEDNLFAQKGVSLLLKSLGCHVEVADCGKKAIDIFKPGKYHLVFMDIGLPDMKGYQVAQHFREIEQGTSYYTPILGLSAHATQEEKQLSAAADMAEVLSKPLLHDQAIKVLREYVVNIQSKKEEIDLCQMQDGLRIIDLEKKPDDANPEEKFAWEILADLKSSLATYCMEIEGAYKTGCIDLLMDKVHKLHGDLCYTKTPHLLQTVQALERTLKTGRCERFEAFYSDFLQAVDIFEKTYKAAEGS